VSNYNSRWKVATKNVGLVKCIFIKHRFLWQVKQHDIFQIVDENTNRDYHHHHYHHHWHDSPLWAVAFLKIIRHSSLLIATLLQFFTPRILMSWHTHSSHLNFGFPTLLFPSGLVLNIFLMILFSLSRITYPTHLSLFYISNYVWFVK
jgi:hypothetical protein